MKARNIGMLVVVISLLVLAACSSSQQQSGNLEARTVRAESFELTDSDGTVRAEMKIIDGSPEFVLKGESGDNRLQIRLDESGNPALSLFDASGSRRAGFEFANGTNPALFLRDENGRLKAGMQVQSEGEPLLFLRNSMLEDGFAVTLIDQDLPVVALSDPNGNRRAFLGLEEAGFSGSLIFVAADGSIEAILP